MKHTQFEYVKTLVENNIPTLLEGPAGTGKTTLAKDIATALNLKFYNISWCKQTTKNDVVGFINLNHEYMPPQFREALEHGGLMLWDELDAADANTLLIFNTIENGYMTFPDKIVHVHQDFRLIATANPSDQHSQYTGRSKLDAATLDRFEPVPLNRDDALEIELTSQESFDEISIARKVLTDNNVTKQISMRDAIRYHKRKNLKLDTEPIKKLFKDDDAMFSTYTKDLIVLRPPPLPKQEDAKTTKELFNIIQREASTEQGKLQE